MFTSYMHRVSLLQRPIYRKLLSFHTEMVSVYFLSENVLLRGDLQKDVKSAKFEKFESL